MPFSPYMVGNIPKFKVFFHRPFVGPPLTRNLRKKEFICWPFTCLKNAKVQHKRMWTSFFPIIVDKSTANVKILTKVDPALGLWLTKPCYLPLWIIIWQAFLPGVGYKMGEQTTFLPMGASLLSNEFVAPVNYTYWKLTTPFRLQSTILMGQPRALSSKHARISKYGRPIQYTG